jgi:hypothetical protein
VASLAAIDRLVTPARVRDYAVILLGGYFVGVAVLLATLRHGLDARGNPPGADFIIFYGVSVLTLKGQAVLAYAPNVLLAAERGAVAASRGLYLWTYPPTFQLIVAPLALAKYGWALAAWTAAGLAAYLATLRGLVGGWRGLLYALAFPGVFMNLTQGQTGFLLVALLGGGLLLLDKRPWLAGALLGLLAVKPQFGLLLPLLLLADGRWKAIAAAAAASLALATVATLAYGPDAWRDFLAAAAKTSGYLASGALPIAKDPSLFAALKLWGAQTPLALAAHAVSAVLAAVLAWRVWRGGGPLELKAGVAVLATLIALPYLFDYDLALLAVPIAVAARRAAGAPVGVKSVLVLLAFLPIIVAPLGHYLHIPIGPAALWCGLWALLALPSAAEA